MSAVLRSLAAILLGLGALSYADWVLQLVLPVRADVTTSFVSELSVGSQPYHDLFRAIDAGGGVVLVAGAVLAAVIARRWLATWALLAFLGACCAVEAALPLRQTYTYSGSSSSSSSSSGFVFGHVGTSEWWGRVSEPHGVISALETVSFLLLLVVCSRALRRARVRPSLRRVIAAIGGAAVLGGLADALLTATLLIAGETTVLGLVQRTSVTLTAVWLLLASTVLLSRSGTTRLELVLDPVPEDVLELGDQRFAGALDHRQDDVEAGGAAVVGVGYVGAGMGGVEVAEEL
ncbi:hypothetical protein GCM10027076_07370 [Nocardioides montaniterrae]